MVRINDHAVSVDILKQIMKPEIASTFLTLDICVTLLPLLKSLFESKFEE